MTVNPLEMFKSRAIELVNNALASLDLNVELPLEIPPENMGDYAFPCFMLSKEMKKSPADIAKQLSQEIPEDLTFSRIEARGPYINFYINPEMLVQITIESIMDKREEYGMWPQTDVKINLEHTSANPNGPLHVGRARNPILGDTIARILRKCGHDVITEFYVDDMGKQQVTLTWGVENLTREGEIPEKMDHAMVWYYQEATKQMEENPDVLEQINQIVAKYEEKDEEISARVKENCKKVLSGMTTSLRRLDIHFDNFAWESKYIFNGSVDTVVEDLKNHEFTDYEDSALYLDLEKVGITGQENKLYLTRSDGSSLYTTRDIAYHLDKLANYDLAIDILGEDHKLKAKVVQLAVGLLGHEKEKIEPLFYSFVSLPEGKMSTRKGRVVTLDDLIDESVGRAREEVEKRRPELAQELRRGIAEAVGTGAIRYNIIRVQAEKQIVFKWEEALSFEGNSAPFVQYSHARASSILRKTSVMGEYELKLIKHPSEIQLVKALASFPALIKECGKNMECHPMAGYAFELASLFNQFYRDCPVLQAEEDVMNARLALVTVSRYVMSNVLDTLGLIAPEEM
ncbi:MAG: arginine--tRNA ligase [Thermoplasmata archaeon]|nr:arginine--tRNA ligase [Thermoplasmata archaeon]